MTNAPYRDRFHLAKSIAKSAGRKTLDYFQTDRFEVIRKGDGSPLTVADQETERFLRDEIAKNFPDDEIMGEEFGHTPGDSGFKWVLDPIDGTRSFIHGVPLYGTMVAVIDQRDMKSPKAVIGAIHIPGLNEGIYASTGQGAWHYQGDAEPVRASVSDNKSLADSIFVTTGMETFFERDAADKFVDLSRAVEFSRTWGDVYGYLLVATGRAEAMVDPALNIWDAAAVQPIIEEAGGIFTDWKNRPTFDGGDAIGSNGQFHQQILDILTSN